MNLRPEEISSVIKEQIKQYSTKLETSDIGTVIQVADGITRIHGLEKAMQGELLEFPGEVYAPVLLEASRSSFARRSSIVLSPLLREKVVIQRSANACLLSGLTSIGT